MRALREHLHVLSIVLVNLAALQYLQRDATIGVVSKERTTTRLANVLHDTTDANRPVELVLQEDMQLCIFHVLEVGHIAAKGVANEADDVLEVVVTKLAAIEQTQVTEYLLLRINKHTSDDLLPEDRIALQAVWHNIIDVLDEDNVALQVVEILDERTMPTRTEQ